MTDLPPTDITTAAPLFNDGKDPAALRTIGEVARALHIKPHVLRYWEEQFPTLQPIKRSGSRRYYRPEDVALISDIYRLVNLEGYTLRGAANALMAKSQAAESVSLPPATASAGSSFATSGIIARLMDVRRELAEALARA